MRTIQLIFTAILLSLNAFGISSYSEGDTLITLMDIELKFEGPQNGMSTVIIKKGEKVVVKEDKYTKSGDDIVNDLDEVWSQAISGINVQVDYNGKAGSVFDGFLTSFDISYIESINDFEEENRLDLLGSDYNARLVKKRGVTLDYCTGMAHADLVYSIPEFSMEESVFLALEALRFELERESEVDIKWRFELNLDRITIDVYDDPFLSFITIQRFGPTYIIFVEHIS